MILRLLAIDLHCILSCFGGEVLLLGSLGISGGFTLRTETRMYIANKYFVAVANTGALSLMYQICRYFD